MTGPTGTSAPSSPTTTRARTPTSGRDGRRDGDRRRQRDLQHEETELEPQLAPHLETPEWKAVEKKLRNQPLPEAGRFFAWLTDGMSEEHRVVLRRTVPPPVVTVLSKVFGRRYYRDVAPTWKV